MNPNPYELRSDLPEELAELRPLALDLRWSWSHVADALWRRIDEPLWRHTRNPWLILQSVSARRLRELADDASFRKLLQTLRAEQHSALGGETWFAREHGDANLGQIAYFCMEYGLSEALPLYSGGLGVLAGDHLKTCSELGVPLHALGLLYQKGYFRQSLDADGNQLAFYPINDPSLLPVIPVRGTDGEWLCVTVELPGRGLRLRAWQAQLGRVVLYLLDSNDPLNDPADRGITSELYGGGAELRLQQEIILGIGGYRLLRALGIEPSVCHLNEGHAAFAILERANAFAHREGVDFSTALIATRAGNLFTTHTPVDAGFDRFDPALLERYLGAWAEDAGIGRDALLALGRADPEDSGEAFNMAWLAIHGSGAVNGVSRLHGEVSRRLFQTLFPRWPGDEVPVGHITNGVHVPSRDAPESDRLWTEVSGKERWRGDLREIREVMPKMRDADLWEMRARNRLRLIDWVRQRDAGSRASMPRADNALDPNALTLGFARRFATYKRPNLLLHDPERLHALLTNTNYPVQLLIAGKAHPRDHEGQAMIREWIHFIRDRGLQRHVVFLVDYDLLVAAYLVEGVDLWINTPRRPWEACGTSGMKVLVNGGLNLSELDGWWAEAWRPGVGWALGDGCEHGAGPEWDAREAECLYQRLEQAVIPAFYQRDTQGIPQRWTTLMRNSMAELTPAYSSNRMLRDYVEQHYLPLARAYHERAARSADEARAIQAWRKRLQGQWQDIHFGNQRVDSDEKHHYFHVQLYLDDLDPDDVRVELYAEALPGGVPERRPLNRIERLTGAVNGYLYEIVVPAQRAVGDYTVRVVPNHPGVAIPLEEHRILWQR